MLHAGGVLDVERPLQIRVRSPTGGHAKVRVAARPDLVALRDAVAVGRQRLSRAVRSSRNQIAIEPVAPVADLEQRVVARGEVGGTPRHVLAGRELERRLRVAAQVVHGAEARNHVGPHRQVRHDTIELPGRHEAADCPRGGFVDDLEIVEPHARVQREPLERPAVLCVHAHVGLEAGFDVDRRVVHVDRVGDAVAKALDHGAIGQIDFLPEWPEPVLRPRLEVVRSGRVGDRGLDRVRSLLDRLRDEGRSAGERILNDVDPRRIQQEVGRSRRRGHAGLIHD